MAFNPNASYTTLFDCEGQMFILQSSVYYNREGDALAALPNTPSGYKPPFVPLTSGNTISGTAISGSTGSFTTLAASSTVSGTGFTNYMAAPPSIGATTPGIVKTSNLQATFTDSSGTPGNVTNSSPRGRAAFAAAGASVVVTSTLVTATSSVLVQLGGSDATLTTVRVTPGAGTFTVTGNAAATGITPFDFLVVN